MDKYIVTSSSYGNDTYYIHKDNGSGIQTGNNLFYGTLADCNAWLQIHSMLNVKMK